MSIVSTCYSDAVDSLQRRGVTELEISTIFTTSEVETIFKKNLGPPYWGIVPGNNEIKEDYYDDDGDDFSLGNDIAAFIVDIETKN